MSLTSKLAIQAALNISSRHDIDYGIFVSRHGELQRTFKLLNDILAGEEASPTAFSQSVHNTASGLFTIVAQKAIPVTSLAACQDSFLQGVIEAYARFNSSDDKKVLLTCFDDFVPDVYSSFTDELPFCYVLAILLEKGDSWEIASEENTEVSNELRLPQALQFMQSYTLQKKSFYVDGTRNSWMWTCAS